MAPANSNSVEIRGKTVDEAVQRALSQLKLPRSQVEVHVLDEGRPGIFGVGATSALVRVTPSGEGGSEPEEGQAPLPRIDDYADPEEASPSDPRERGGRRGRGRRGGRGRGSGSGDSAPAADGNRSATDRPDSSRSSSESDSRPDSRRGGRGRSDRGRDREGGRGRDREGDRGRDREGGRGRRGGRDRESRPTYPTPPIQLEAFDLLADPEFEPEEDGTKMAVNVVTDLLHLIGIRAVVSSRAPETPMDGLDHAITVVDIKSNEASDDLSLLVGPHGEHLAAIQYITNVILSRSLDGEHPVTVDVDGYKRRREDELIDLAKDAAAEAKETGDAIELDAMNAAERRIIHLNLSEVDGIETESEGSGDARRVVIVYRDGE